MEYFTLQKTKFIKINPTKPNPHAIVFGLLIDGEVGVENSYVTGRLTTVTCQKRELFGTCACWSWPSESTIDEHIAEAVYYADWLLNSIARFDKAGNLR